METEDALKRGLAAIDEIYFCADQLSMNMGMATEYEAARIALLNLVSRVQEMPLLVEEVYDAASTKSRSKP